MCHVVARLAEQLLCVLAAGRACQVAAQGSPGCFKLHADALEAQQVFEEGFVLVHHLRRCQQTQFPQSALSRHPWSLFINNVAVREFQITAPPDLSLFLESNNI